MSNENDSYCFDCGEDVSIEYMYDAIQCQQCHARQVEEENNSW